MLIWQVLLRLGEGSNVCGNDGSDDSNYHEEDDKDVTHQVDDLIEVSTEASRDKVFLRLLCVQT